MSSSVKPWNNEYKIFGIPDSFEPYPDEPVYDILARTAKKYKKNGLIQYDYKMTYPELKEQVDKLASALLMLGLKKGERVATILPTSIQFVIADYAISRAGLVHIPASSLEPVSTLEHKFLQGSPRALICLANNLETAKRLQATTDIRHVILTKLEDYASNMIELSEYEEICNDRDILWMADLIKYSSGEVPDLSINVAEDMETLLFTGGTTGVPRGCMLTHRNVYANAIQNLYGFGHASQVIRGAVSVLLGLPFFHSYGHIIMHTMTLFGVNQILIPEPRDTGTMVRMIKKHYPALHIGVPTQFMKLSDEKLDGVSMLAISGSAPLPKNTQDEFEKKAGSGIMEGYGLSEMSPCTHLNTSLLIRLFGGEKIARGLVVLMKMPGITPLLNGLFRLQGPKLNGFIMTKLISKLMHSSAGKKDRASSEKRGTIGIPYPDTEVKIVDVDTREKLTWEDLSAGRVGELYLKGPQRMKGYWPQPGSGIDDEGFVNTSDVVKLDSRGYFYVVDRTKDMVIVSGYKVYTREVDEILHGHPAIEMAATLGIPDPDREGSERVAVFFQARDQHRERISEDEIEAFLVDRVAKYAVPKFIRKIESMPLTAVQKVDKKVLKEMALKELLGKEPLAEGG